MYLPKARVYFEHPESKDHCQFVVNNPMMDRPYWSFSTYSHKCGGLKCQAFLEVLYMGFLSYRGKGRENARVILILGFLARVSVLLNSTALSLSS